MEQWIVEQNIDRFEKYLRLHFSPADRSIVEDLLSTERRKLNEIRDAASAESPFFYASLN
ncbi:MAG TPA: hypothetical protein PK808_08495 [Polymorphobacter sp.]|nr:hypothetical protein [Polymorphobacter sp.]